MNDVENSERLEADVSVTLRLIAEYTRRLLEACQFATKAETRRLMLSLLTLLFGVSAAVSAYYAGARYWVPLLLLGPGAAFLSMGLELRTRTLARDEVRLASRALAVLVRHASAVYEHRVLNTTDRLQLQVRLGEAEAALEISERYGARIEAVGAPPLALEGPVQSSEAAPLETTRRPVRTGA